MDLLNAVNLPQRFCCVRYALAGLVLIMAACGRQYVAVPLPPGAKVVLNHQLDSMTSQIVLVVAEFPRSEVEGFLGKPPYSDARKSTSENCAAWKTIRVSGWNPENAKRYFSGHLVLNNHEGIDYTIALDDDRIAKGYFLRYDGN